MKQTKRGSSLLSETPVGLIIGISATIILITVFFSMFVQEQKKDLISQSLIDQIENALKEAKEYSYSEIIIPQQLSNEEKYFLVNFQEKENIKTTQFESIKEYNFYNTKNQICICSTDELNEGTIYCNNYCINSNNKINNLNVIPLNKKTYITIDYQEKQFNFNLKNVGEIIKVENTDCINYLEILPPFIITNYLNLLTLCNAFPTETVKVLKEKLEKKAGEIGINEQELLQRNSECKSLVNEYDNSVFIKIDSQLSELRKEQTINICINKGITITKNCLEKLKQKENLFGGEELEECLI